MTKSPEGPQRPRSHVVGDLALSRFNALRRQEWVVNESGNDYGWDLLVSLESKGVVMPEDFFVQLKGSDTPTYIDKGTKISFSLETSTVKWLLGKPQPSMLAVCDARDSEQPIYWVWLDDAIPEMLKRRPKALGQKTLTIHIPVENVLTPSACQEIENHVLNFHTHRKIKETIGTSILPTLERSTIDNPLQYRETPGSFLLGNMGPWVRAGMIEPSQIEDVSTVKALSPQDRTRFQQLRDIQNALRELRERDAIEQLDALKDEIENDASCYVKAIFHRTKGRLLQHMYRLSDAVEQYEVALELRPGDLHTEADLLHAKFSLACESRQLLAALPRDWQKRVDEVLAKLPNECRLIRLKAIYIAHTKDPKEAEIFLRNSVSWDREQKETLGYIAHLYCEAGELDEAERILQEAANLGIRFDAIDWSLYGHVFLKRALRVFGSRIDSPIYGPGPADLDLDSAKKAAKWYRKACQYFGGKGFPIISQETVVNYVVVLRLLGDVEEGIRVCLSYLDNNPEDPHVHSALAGCLLLADKAGEAVPHAKVAFDADPASTLAFRNLIACLCQAEEFGELLTIVEERRRSGFADIEEEGLSWITVVIALTENGDYSEAQRWTNHLESKNDLKNYAAIAKATLWSKQDPDKERVYETFRKALAEYPNDLHLLSHFVAELLPLREETAAEIVSCLGLTRKHRQLAPHEFLLLAKGLLLLKQPDAADKELSEANQRYPDSAMLMAEWVNVKVELGEEQQAYELLMDVMNKEGPNHNVLYDLAILAANMGRLDAAIRFFERAEGKARGTREQGIIHRYLFQLRMERGDNPADILRHVVKFGKTASSPEDEAAYLIMFMLAPKPGDLDDDLKESAEDFRIRLAQFTTEYPNFDALKSVRIPDAVTEKNKGFHLWAELWALMLPHELATAPLWQSARLKPWPLVFRASHMPGTSLFRYWSTCVRSHDFENSIHIYGQENDVTREATAASMGKNVCVDITGLLTLAGLNLLDLLTEIFEVIIVAQGTRRAIWMENSPILGVHPLAAAIQAWTQANQHKIRVRHAGTDAFDVKDAVMYETSMAGILTERRSLPLNVLLPNGVGESLLIAARLSIPLYSDESSIRVWAENDHGITSFSTVGIARSLVERRIWTLAHEVDILTNLIRWNYRWVPFSNLHLNARLRAIVDDCKVTGASVSPEALQRDEALWLLMRTWGESAINEGDRVRWAINWWLSIMDSDFFGRDVLAAGMTYPTDCIATASKASVLVGRIPKNEREIKAASLLAGFLWKSYVKSEKQIPDIWLAIRDCVGDLFPTREEVVFALMPACLLDVARSEGALTPGKKTSFLYDLISRLPAGDKQPFELHLLNNVHKLR